MMRTTVDGAQLQRRQFLERIGNGLGPIALSSLIADDVISKEQVKSRCIIVGRIAFSREGKTRYLSFSIRSSLAIGFV